MSATSDIRHAVAVSCVERVTGTGTRGKKRDDLALDYFLGAAAAARACGFDASASSLEVTAALLIASRGYGEVEKIAKAGPRNQAPSKAVIESLEA